MIQVADNQVPLKKETITLQVKEKRFDKYMTNFTCTLFKGVTTTCSEKY